MESPASSEIFLPACPTNECNRFGVPKELQYNFGLPLSSLVSEKVAKYKAFHHV
jgi:hypothetical protein